MAEAIKQPSDTQDGDTSHRSQNERRRKTFSHRLDFLPFWKLWVWCSQRILTASIPNFIIDIIELTEIALMLGYTSSHHLQVERQTLFAASKSDFFGKHPRWGFMLLNLMLFMCSLGVSLELKALKMDSMYFGISARTPRDDFMFNISLIILWVKNFLEDVCALGVKASLMKKAFIEAFEACLLGIIENMFWLAGALPFFYRALTFLLSCFDQRQNFLHCAVCAFIRPRTNF